jgi:hypothetical protein
MSAQQDATKLSHAESLKQTTQFLQAEGEQAVQHAKQHLLEQGVGYVIGDESTVHIVNSKQEVPHNLKLKKA